MATFWAMSLFMEDVEDSGINDYYGSGYIQGTLKRI